MYRVVPDEQVKTEDKPNLKGVYDTLNLSSKTQTAIK